MLRWVFSFNCRKQIFNNIVRWLWPELITSRAKVRKLLEHPGVCTYIHTSGWIPVRRSCRRARDALSKAGGCGRAGDVHSVLTDLGLVRQSVRRHIQALVRVGAARGHLPEHQSHGVHVHLLKRRLAVTQIDGAFQHLRRHVPQRAHLSTERTAVNQRRRQPTWQHAANHTLTLFCLGRWGWGVVFSVCSHWRANLLSKTHNQRHVIQKHKTFVHSVGRRRIPLTQQCVSPPVRLHNALFSVGYHDISHRSICQ